MAAWALTIVSVSSVLAKPTAEAAAAVDDRETCSSIFAVFDDTDYVLPWGYGHIQGFEFRSCDSNYDGFVGPGDTQDWTVRALVDSTSLDWVTFLSPDSSVVTLHPVVPVDPPGGDGTRNRPLYVTTRRLTVGHTYDIRVENIGEASGGGGLVTVWLGSVTCEPVSMTSLEAVASDSSYTEVQLSWSRTDSVSVEMSS